MGSLHTTRSHLLVPGGAPLWSLKPRMPRLLLHPASNPPLSREETAEEDQKQEEEEEGEAGRNPLGTPLWPRPLSSTPPPAEEDQQEGRMPWEEGGWRGLP